MALSAVASALSRMHDPQYMPAAPAVMLAIFTIPLFVLDLFQNAGLEEYPWSSRSPVLRMATAMLALLISTILAAPEANAFIYFQFQARDARLF